MDIVAKYREKALMMSGLAVNAIGPGSRVAYESPSRTWNALADEAVARGQARPDSPQTPAEAAAAARRVADDMPIRGGLDAFFEVPTVEDLADLPLRTQGAAVAALKLESDPQTTDAAKALQVAHSATAAANWRVGAILAAHPEMSEPLL